MAKESQIRKILIKSDVTGAKDIKSLSKELGLLNNSVKTMQESFSTLGTVFSGLLAYFSVSQIVKFSDEMQLLTDRISVFTGSAESARVVVGNLTEAANRTRTSVDGLATTYSRLATATKDTGISSGLLVGVTETLQNTFRLSGSTTQEATGASIQLAQGLGAASLRGQELRSVMESNAVFSQILAKSLGVPIGQLRKLAEKDGIKASQVLKAIFENQEALRESAGKLGQTFEQTLNVALNNLKLKLLDVNKAYQLSEKFANLVTVGVEKFTLVLSVLGTVFAASLIPKIVAFVAAINPITAAIGALVTIISGSLIYAFDNLDHLLETVSAGFSKLADGIKFISSTINSALNFLFIGDELKRQFGIAEVSFDFMQKSMVSGLRSIAAAIKPVGKSVADLKKADDEYFSRDRVARLEKIEQQKLLAALAKKEEENVLKGLSAVERLNRELALGRISLDQYFSALPVARLKELNDKFKETSYDIFKFKKEVLEIERAGLVYQLNRGTISLDNFNKAIEKNKVEELNNKFAEGKITLQEYNSQLIEITDNVSSIQIASDGVQNYLKEIGTFAKQTSGLITNAFKSLEESFFQFTKTGKFNFSEFAQSVLDDLNRIIIRSLILRPLAQGILSSFAPGSEASGVGGGGPGGSSVTPFQGKTAFQPGGVYATGYPSSAQAKTSQSNMYVNVVNNSQAQIEQRESTNSLGEKTLDILITGKVKEAFASGQFDRTMSQAYGIRRKGT